MIALLIICLSPMAFAQADTCSKPRVAVQLTEIHDGVFEMLNSNGVPQPRESWILQIQGKVLEELRMGSPGTEFVPVAGVGGAVSTDFDYRFQYIMSIIGAGESIEIWGGLLQSEYTAFYMSSKLAQNNPCPGSDWLLDVEITKEDEDVFQTVEHNIESWGDIGTRIEEFERSHPVPPRGPTLHVSQSRDYVSPLEEERTLDIKIDVTNCRGEPVYYASRSNGQRVVLPKKTERGEIEPTPGFLQQYDVTDDHVTLIIVRPEGASATYTLKKGIDPDVETIEMTLCGIDKKLVQETEIHIRGLELRVTPEKRRVSPGEKTNIEIKLSRIDENGKKEPLPGKKIELDIRGLVDGDVRPSDEIITGADGVVILEYSAGENDKRVTFSAKFQPKEYDEFVNDETTVTIGHPSEITANITAKFREIYHLHEEDQDHIYDSRHRLEFDVTVEASFKYYKTSSVDKSGTYSQKYKLTSWEITKSSASFSAKSEVISDDEIRTETDEATGKADKNDSTRTLSILFDAQTKKALEVNFPGFSVNIDGTGIHTSSDGEKTESPWRYYYRPIWGPFEEFIKVNSGDGKSSIGGKGIHVFKKQESFDRQTLSVDWNIELN
jgi:hypothetical protein